MAINFWETRYIVYKFKDGVIKLVPRSSIKLRAKDWRALTMLTTVYKILAKILSNRLKPMMPSIICQQQTGFIHDRNILENVSIAWLMKDWLRLANLEGVFLQFDFHKAFDIIARMYLWCALEAVGLGGRFLMLVQGLLEGASSKIHINGKFSEEIDLAGCMVGMSYLPISLCYCNAAFHGIYEWENSTTEPTRNSH